MNSSSLTSLGWQPFFQQQLTLEEWGVAKPARIIEHHKSHIEVATESEQLTLPILKSMPVLVVGDWLLLDADNGFIRVLDRQSCFSRKAPGSKAERQFIAANIDTAFIVCSLNDDFNLNRIERYLSLVHEARVEAVVVLSKADLCPNSEQLREQVQALDNLLCVELINGLDSASVEQLKPWCRIGKTVVMLGSSGAGKSTLVNSLLGDDRLTTASIREGDDKGRHTTTRRSLLSLPDGVMVMDTPGMRELQLTDCEAGISLTFADIEELSQQCRFKDCQHNAEPGCAVRAAVDNGVLDERRLVNYIKLQREQARNSASLAERRASDRDLGRFYKLTQSQSKQFKRNE